MWGKKNEGGARRDAAARAGRIRAAGCYCFTTALLLLYQCFTTALLLRIRAAGYRELGVGVGDITDYCFTTALPLLYYCFTTALLLLYYCFTTPQDIANSVWAFVTAGAPCEVLLGLVQADLSVRGVGGFKSQERAPPALLLLYCCFTAAAVLG